MNEDNLQDPQTQQQSTEPVDVFKEISNAVGKNYSDKDALIKALTEKDNFIETLKTANANTLELVEALSTKVDQSINAQKVLEELQAKKPEADATPGQTANKEDVASIFNELYSSKEKETRAKANQATVNSKLAELYGDKAAEVLKTKAESLGLELDRIKELASESPQAVLSLLGATSGQPKQAGLPPSGAGAPTEAPKSTPFAEFKAEMKARGIKPTHANYFLEMNKRKDLFNN